MAQTRTTITDLRPLLGKLAEKFDNELILHRNSAPRRTQYQLRERIENNGEREISGYYRVREMEAFMRGLLGDYRHLEVSDMWDVPDHDYPIIEEGTVLKETGFPHRDVEVVSMYADEDGIIQVKVAHKNPGLDEHRSVTLSDVYDRIDNDELEPV